MIEAKDRGRRKRDGKLQWAVHLNEDRRGNCRSCQAPIYWIKTPSGKNLPMSEATSERSDLLPLNVVWMECHFADCEQADAWRRAK